MLTIVQDAEASTENLASSSLLEEIAGNRAWQMRATALQAEVIADGVDEHGRRLVVRSGYHAEREVVTAAGAVGQPNRRVRREAETSSWG